MLYKYTANAVFVVKIIMTPCAAQASKFRDECCGIATPVSFQGDLMIMDVTDQGLRTPVNVARLRGET